MSTTPREAPPARLFFGVFTGFEELFDWVRDRLSDRFGPLDSDAESVIFPFPRTRSYHKTMGSGLQRKFFFLRENVAQDCLASIKHQTIEIERAVHEIRQWPVPRPINIDPGILNDCRILLASTKDYSHRIYRGDGIWEEVTLIFQHGGYQVLPWTYPDFQRREYHDYFAKLRLKYLRTLRRP